MSNQYSTYLDDKSYATGIRQKLRTHRVVLPLADYFQMKTADCIRCLSECCLPFLDVFLPKCKKEHFFQLLNNGHIDFILKTKAVCYRMDNPAGQKFL